MVTTIPGWPVGRRYRGHDRTRVSLPVGGIGTGTIGFGGRGQFRDWEIENHPSKGTRSPLTFLGCRATGPTVGTVARVLEGDLFDEEVEGEIGAPAPLSGLPRFEHCEFEATYPFGRVALADDSFPVRADVEVFNPLCPGDEDLSGLPIVAIRVRLTSEVDEPLDVSVMLSAEVLVGHARRRQGLPSRPVATAMKVATAQGYLLSDEAMDPSDEESGTIAAAVLGGDTWVGPTWALGKWNQGLLAMWNGFVSSGIPDSGIFGLDGPGPSSDTGQSIAGTLGATRTIGARQSTEVEFLLAWRFPNRRAWMPSGQGARGMSGPDTVGNFYACDVANAWEVVRRDSARLAQLRSVTERFVTAFWDSDLAPAVKEAALFSVSTLRSNTFFRTADGRPFGWEGCMDDVGSCLGSCTHVWNYDLATPFLFSGLARQMRELEYGYATAPDGAMSFRIMLPLDRAQEQKVAAADGQFGCVVKLYREWRLCGDDEWLRTLWPECRRSLEFAWIEGGWDGDRDGVAEGAQHNTMDVEYYGPNPVIQGWYLAALKAASDLAVVAGDDSFAATCADLLARGSAATETLLFNGSYYQQEVIPPKDFSTVAAQLRHSNMGAQQADKPEFQIEHGCIIDQLVGDTYARIAGLGRVFDPANAGTALESIHRLNFIEDFGDWSNCMRTYAVRGERGHIVLSYPSGLPEHPMPYWSEVWTGLEYVFATGLAQAGRTALADEVVTAVRERFTGNRRNPFDEAECGHHYARGMASWGLVVAMTGFGYDARSGQMSFAAAPSAARWFWSAGHTWGTIRQSLDEDGVRKVQLEVLSGSLRVNTVVVGGDVYRPGASGDLEAGAAWDLEPTKEQTVAD
jgi:non-lysosomal glucosylceramidase